MTPEEGRRLRNFVERHLDTSPGWHSELAARLGVSRQALSGWWTGRSSPTLDSLGALASALGVSRCSLVCAMWGES